MQISATTSYNQYNTSTKIKSKDDEYLHRAIAFTGADNGSSDKK